MYFFSETSGSIAPGGSIPLGNWNVAGYQQITLHAWVKGGSGTAYLQLYFNGLQAGSETLTITPSSFSWSVDIITRTYPVFAPTLGVVLGTPSWSSQMDFKMRLYAACCEPKQGVLSGLMTRLFGRPTPAADGEPHRTLGRDVDMESLLPEQPPSDTGQTE
jgi:hypothetical protein